ncbi:DUF1816 domain-containing protein [Neosynechococcus sphagnicola]|uniref:DUF1816 domain-containing protein n=1 Tax=Neosynechococcus sphagnicola TaxID=1501145 RepID=UPI00068E09EB|nr:DUF1816 domain-containing protein [Neosynechococcus sphagnicola]
MQEALLKIVNTLGYAWWVEVITEQPACTYYFGPFMFDSSAHAATSGYVEDLAQEGAQGIHAVVKRCKPVKLTIAADEMDEITAQNGSAGSPVIVSFRSEVGY